MDVFLQLLSFHQNCLKTFPKQKLIWKLTTEISDTFWIQKILISMQRKSKKSTLEWFPTLAILSLYYLFYSDFKDMENYLKAFISLPFEK